MKTVIAYGSSTGNTQTVAEAIRQALDGELVSVASAEAAEKLTAADVLVLGTSTWGLGDLQDDWADFLAKLEAMDLTGKKVALFGLGDQASWGDTFVDGMGILYETVVKCGAEVVGTVAREGYDFGASRALKGDQFVGLPLDADNQADQTAERIENWTMGLKRALGMG
jgi:flavodoxin I